MATNLERMDQLRSTADAVEKYTDDNLFDGFGLMMSGIDSHTDEPFPESFITEEKVPRRANFDPWSYWTYEDSIKTAGHYMEGLVLKYELTDDEAALDRAKEVWSSCWDVFSQSEVYGGLGCFLRPYGGFDKMETFGEPLGTDQAAPLLYGSYRLLEHVDGNTRTRIVDMLVRTLKWYADRNYTHRYYKSFTVSWHPPLHHQASFYLPALALAAVETQDEHWWNDLETHLDRQLNDDAFVESERGVAWGFKQGGLLILQEILGDTFEEYLTPNTVDQMSDEVTAWLSEYDEDWVKPICPESTDPGFEPYQSSEVDPYDGFGWAHNAWVHGGRERPRHEITVLTQLAGLGRDDAIEQAIDLLELRRTVPEEFTQWLSDDYEDLPDAVHIRSRSVGAVMVDWWRQYWVLRSQIV